MDQDHSRSRVLVLGADGFIGRALWQALGRQPWATPIAAGRRPAGAAHGNPARITLDATDGAALAAACADADVVVFCLAGPSAQMRAALEALIQAVRSAASPPLVVFLSSIAVYGDATRTVDEDAPLDAAGSDYAQLKIDSESRVREACPRWIVLRPGIVYGPGSALWTAHIAALLRAGRIDLPAVSMQAACNLIPVEDLARCIIACLREPGVQGRTLNAVAPGAPTWAGYFNALADALGAPRPRAAPAWRRTWAHQVLGPVSMALHRVARLLGVRRPEPAVLRPWLMRQCARGPRVDAGLLGRTVAMDWTPADKAMKLSAQWVRGAETGGPG